MGNPQLFKTIDKAVYDYRMVEENDRILIGASGGKDSTALIEYFAARKRLRRKTENLTITALHVQSELSAALSSEQRALFDEWQVPLVAKEISLRARLGPKKTLNCWWCTTQRRIELYNYAEKNNFNKIALGHHLDDLLETLLMNALEKGILSTMPPVLRFRKFPITFIRPLCLADSAMILRHVQQAGYPYTSCTCSYQSNSIRNTAQDRLQALTAGKYSLKRKLFEALKNIDTEYLP